MLDLSNKSITLVMVSDVQLEECTKSFEQSMLECNFTDHVLLTSTKHQLSHVRTIPIEPINSRKEYSKFILQDLVNYVNTDYCLIIQYDGFVVNQYAWTNEFLAYDYVGTPCSWGRPLENGCGGFNLRSRKLLAETAVNIDRFKDRNYDPEDFLICKINKQFFIDRGIKFAPVELCHQFGWQRIGRSNPVTNDYQGQFGIHDGINRDEYKTFYKDLN